MVTLNVDYLNTGCEQDLVIKLFYIVHTYKIVGSIWKEYLGPDLISEKGHFLA